MTVLPLSLKPERSALSLLRMHHPNSDMDIVAPYQLLLRATEQIMNGQLTLAQTTLADLIATVEGHPQALQYQLFARGLAQHLTESGPQQANLYLADLPVNQIDLFNLLAKHVPFVSLSAKIANECLAQFCHNQDEVWLIDIGMGTGRQLVTLLEQLHREQQLPTHIHIVGIEPAAESLVIADSTLRAAAQKMGCAIEFLPICRTAEALSAAEWQAIRARVQHPVINASFALHHIRDTKDGTLGQIDQRNHVLKQLLTLTPRVLVLSEPNVDHLEPNLRQRLQNCWHHFGTVFHVIDQLPIRSHEKEALKVNFFGREIDDILRPEETLRTERHEPVERWLQRLSDSGYQTVLPVRMNQIVPPIQVRGHDGYVGLDYGEETVISVICATPVNSN